jgi:ABC-type arginine/histidine transport system permease subunit
VQLLIIYTGIYSLEFVHAHERLDEFFREGLNCTILAFALNTAAYTTEIFAGAIRSIPYGEIEAAKAFGMSPWKRYTRIIIPSMLRRALPFYGNEVILMLHATTIAFTATDEVTECHTITGSVEYLLRVEVADIKSYKKFHTDVLGTIPSISSITSFLVMDTTKNRYTNL